MQTSKHVVLKIPSDSGPLLLSKNAPVKVVDVLKQLVESTSSQAVEEEPPSRLGSLFSSLADGFRDEADEKEKNLDKFDDTLPVKDFAFVNSATWFSTLLDRMLELGLELVSESHIGANPFRSSHTMLTFRPVKK